MAGGCLGLLFGPKKAQEVSAVHQGNAVGLVGREVTGMLYVQVPCSSDLLLRAALVCEERNAISPGK